MLILNAVKDELKLGKSLQGNTFAGVNLVLFRAGFRFQTLSCYSWLCVMSVGVISGTALATTTKPPAPVDQAAVAPGC